MTPSPYYLTHTAAFTPEPTFDPLTLIVPEADAVLYDHYPAFIWTAHPDATHYRLVVRRAGAQNPRIRIRLAAEQICEGGFCGVDSLGLTPAAPLGFDRQFTWQVIAFAGDKRLGRARGQFSVQRPAQPTVTPYYTPEGQPPVTHEYTPTPFPLGGANTLDTSQAAPGSVIFDDFAILMGGDSIGLRSAINEGNSRPQNVYRIYLRAGSYDLTQTLVVKGNVEIYGRGSDPGLTIIRQTGTPGTAPNAMNGIFTLPGVRLKLDNLAIINGTMLNFDRVGGAIWVQSLDVPSSRLEISNVRFENNVAELAGGAIYLNRGEMIVPNSRFIDNRAERGGAIYNSPGSNTATITCSVFRLNAATGTAGLGGAIAHYGITGVFSVRDSQFRNNQNNLAIADMRRHAYGYIETNRLDARGNYWVNPPVPTPNSFGVDTRGQLLNAPDCPSDAPVSIPYPIYFADDTSSSGQAWTQNERNAVRNGADRTGQALERLFTQLNRPVLDKQDAFRRVIVDGTRPGFILFIRTNGSSGSVSVPHPTRPGVILSYSRVGIGTACKAFEGNPSQDIPQTVVCNAGVNVTQHTVVHELGHLLDYRNATNDIIQSRLSQSLGSCPLNTDPDSWYTVMGIRSSEERWRRGARGWGTGPAGTLTLFQQNSSDPESKLEAAADMFLNWVYRYTSPNAGSIVTGVNTGAPTGGCIPVTQRTPTPVPQPWAGFQNRDWSTSPSYPHDWGLPGDVRHRHFIDIMRDILTSTGW